MLFEGLCVRGAWGAISLLATAVVLPNLSNDPRAVIFLSEFKAVAVANVWTGSQWLKVGTGISVKLDLFFLSAEMTKKKTGQFVVRKNCV